MKTSNSEEESDDGAMTVIDDELWKEEDAKQLEINPETLERVDHRFLTQAHLMDLYLSLLS